MGLGTRCYVKNEKIKLVTKRLSNRTLASCGSVCFCCLVVNYKQKNSCFIVLLIKKSLIWLIEYHLNVFGYISCLLALISMYLRSLSIVLNCKVFAWSKFKGKLKSGYIKSNCQPMWTYDKKRFLNYWSEHGL